jgi:SAM-dependent methyltransferase
VADTADGPPGASAYRRAVDRGQRSYGVWSQGQPVGCQPCRTSVTAHEVVLAGVPVEPPGHPDAAVQAEAAIRVTAEILDACCGGRMWWWDKAHPLAVYMDKRVAPHGSRPGRPNWNCTPDILGDFREMPFEDDSFRLVVFDPPHIVRDIDGDLTIQYGRLDSATWQDDIRRGFAECWRVLKPGGTLVFKWAGSLDGVKESFPTTPIVGTRSLRTASKKGGLGTRWIVFYKPEESA